MAMNFLFVFGVGGELLKITELFRGVSVVVRMISAIGFSLLKWTAEQGRWRCKTT
jgi:hypothetical protein